ncbi:MAG: tripartite tricarboxylate transporter TctB family protein [Chloroflexi bacterium]|nr:tripartite tricarboxylate transporter TctB family protein [Chloroflexota bacterium]
MRKLSGSSYSLILIMVAMMVVIVASQSLPFFATRFLPVLVSGIVFVLAAVQLAREISTSARSAPKKEDSSKWGQHLPITLWIGGFALAIYLLGFIVSIALFVLLYMKRHGSRWITSAVTAILLTAIIYSAFQIALKVDFYPGLLFGR